MTDTSRQTASDADRNWRRFVLFRVLFNARFYYPVLAVLFLDLGLSATEYTLLNFAWALAIVFTDLPAGVLADRIGRKPLVVAAACCMVLEMVLLSVAPRNGGFILLLCCLANRVLSGMAEGMASGADEALVFDSLAERGRSSEWPNVLDQVMRWQGAGMIIAMLVGGAVYDPVFMGRLLSPFGVSLHFDQGQTLRFPVYLNLITALLTLWISLGLREPAMGATHAAPEGAGGLETTAWRLVIKAGTWIVKTPAPLFVITAGVLLDSVTRLFLTFSSTYFRIIELPEASFGLIGAAMGGLGFIVSPIARRMAQRGSVSGNFAASAVAILVGLIGLAARWRWWGALFMIPLGAAITAVGFLVSYYLNALVGSGLRATVLSFKGLVFNLGYGFVSLLFAMALRAVRDGGGAEETFGRTLGWLPVWLVATLVILIVLFWRHARELRRPFTAGGAA